MSKRTSSEQLQETTGHIVSEHSNVSIFYRLKHPRKKAKYCMVVLHDLYDYHDRYLFIASKLKPEVLESVAISWVDMRGFGQSGGIRGHIDEFDDYALDLNAVLNAISEKYELKNFLLFGVGMGGLIGLRYYQVYMEHRNLMVDGMILVNPLLKFYQKSQSLLSRLLEGNNSALSHLKWSTAIELSEIVSPGAELEKLQSDALASSLISLGLHSEIERVAKEVREFSYFIEIPTLFLVSLNNKLVKQEVISLFYKGIPRPYASISSYSQSSHDLLHDKESDKVFSEVFDWLKHTFLK